MSASEESLKKLHKRLAEKMETLLEAEEVSAATLNVIRSFLSDNEITVDTKSDDAMKKLKETLDKRKARAKEGRLSETEKSELGNVIHMYGGNHD